jgi:hypothetical protein
MGTYRVEVCRRVWESASIDIEDADSAAEAAAMADEHLGTIDEDSLDWSTSDADSSAEVAGVAEVNASPRS